MSDLVDFLLARIAEDEQRAHAFEHDNANAQHGLYGRGGTETYRGDWSAVERIGFPPARVLAECEAKRKIVDGYVELIGSGRTEQEQTLRWTCQLLALPYADHLDFQKKWAP